jgi:hypothetical protein
MANVPPLHMDSVTSPALAVRGAIIQEFREHGTANEEA